ncbi:MAG: hypothetical protein V4490_06750 [Pseudomonadota bacterium]
MNSSLLVLTGEWPDKHSVHYDNNFWPLMQELSAKVDITLAIASSSRHKRILDQSTYQWCKNVFVLPEAEQGPSAWWFQRQPQTTSVWHAALFDWIYREIMTHSIEYVLITSPLFLPYVNKLPKTVKLITYFEKTTSRPVESIVKPLAWYHRYQAKAHMAWEERALNRAHWGIFPKQTPKDYLQWVHSLGCRLHLLADGVDGHYFDPSHLYPNPFSGPGPVILMQLENSPVESYAGMVAFITHVLPHVQQKISPLHVCILSPVGHPMLPILKKIDKLSLIVGVEDTRPYFSHAQVLVWPVEAHIQEVPEHRSVLHALAMCLPVAASRSINTELSHPVAHEAHQPDTPEQWVDLLTELLSTAPDRQRLAHARAIVLHHYSWPVLAQPMIQQLSGSTSEADKKPIAPYFSE